jgi:hypothetical protein
VVCPFLGEALTSQDETVLKSGGEFYIGGTEEKLGRSNYLVLLTLTNRRLVGDRLILANTQIQQGHMTRVITTERHTEGTLVEVPLSSIAEVTVSGGFLGGFSLNIRYRRGDRFYLVWMKSQSGMGRAPKEWAEAIKEAVKKVPPSS